MLEFRRMISKEIYKKPKKAIIITIAVITAIFGSACTRRSLSFNFPMTTRPIRRTNGASRSWRDFSSTISVELSSNKDHFVDYKCDIDNSTTTTTTDSSNHDHDDVIDKRRNTGNINGTSNGNMDDPGCLIPLQSITENNNNNDIIIADTSASTFDKLIRVLKQDMPPTSILLLNLVAIIWGTQHALIKTIVDDSDPAGFTFLRFGLGALLASPYLPGIREIFLPTKAAKKSKKTSDNDDKNRYDTTELWWKPWRWGTELGVWMFIGFSLQAIGLQSTTAQRSGFLLYLNVKLVPFFAYILLGREISMLTWVSALTAFSGTALLALDGRDSVGLNEGDLWSVLAAAASAMFILRLEKASEEVPKSSELNSTSLFVVATLSGLWLILGGSQNIVPNLASDLGEILVSHPFELLYLGAISTALANFIQAKAQKDVKAERASIIYSLDPVYGAFFSWILLGEELGGIQAYVGASMIFVAAATNSLLEFSSNKGEEKWNESSPAKLEAESTKLPK